MEDNPHFGTTKLRCLCVVETSKWLLQYDCVGVYVHPTINRSLNSVMGVKIRNNDFWIT